MDMCRVEIVTFTDGRRSRFTADAAYSCTADGFSAAYQAEGDDVLLTLEGSALSMRRRGASELFVTFSCSEESAMSVGTQGMRGSVPVRTQVCTARRVTGGWRITLRYSLLFDTVQMFRLHIAVNVISEEK